MRVWPLLAAKSHTKVDPGTPPGPGYLKAVWLTIFGPVFLCFRPEIDPGTPLDRRGPPGTSICTKNQPRRPILRPNDGERKIPPDCLQVPRQRGFWTWLKLGRFMGLGGPGAPGTPLDRPGPPRTSTCTKNQTRRPILRPNGGERKVPPDCLQVPRGGGLVIR